MRFIKSMKHVGGAKCASYKKNKPPKCIDQPGCKWIVKQGCKSGATPAKKKATPAKKKATPAKKKATPAKKKNTSKKKGNTSKKKGNPSKKKGNTSKKKIAKTTGFSKIKIR